MQPCNITPDPLDKNTEPFVEIDPTGRYGRYKDLLGAGTVKKVYGAFDVEKGMEVTWNQIKLGSLISSNEETIDRVFSEVRLLKILKNQNIVTLYANEYWIEKEENTFNFITELCTSGNLRQYRQKHRHVSLHAVKKWCKQILKGLEYLHTYKPCIIHRDLNCSNVFVNGNIGQVKIGDMGTAAMVGKNHVARSVLGTPAFMAPEIYDEDYTEMVDIYSFGLCVLELVTLEIPYSECETVMKIYKKVTSGMRPEAMNKVKNPEVKAFIDKCLGQPRKRPSASDLLKDPFFDGLDHDENNNSNI